jgi:hypothetical protein
MSQFLNCDGRRRADWNKLVRHMPWLIRFKRDCREKRRMGSSGGNRLPRGRDKLNQGLATYVSFRTRIPLAFVSKLHRFLGSYDISWS